MQDTAPIAIIGLGLIGTALSERLIDAGMPVIGFDVDPARCRSFEAAGGKIAASVHELAGQSRILVVAVYSGMQAEAVLHEIAGGAGSPRPTVICMTTCAPDEMARLSEYAANAGIALIEAPVSGTSAEVRDGSAVALLAAEPALIESVGTLLDILCPHRLRVGTVGDASRTKLAINLILQANRAALAEGIAFAEALGLDGRTFLATARASAAYSRVMETKGEKMLARDFRPQSHIAQTLKDAELILEEAGRRGLPLPLTAAQAGLLREAIVIEGPHSDSAAVITAIRPRAAVSGALR
ncbi:MAG: NAD(P)-dependent oxidoreductase [Bradyrhizobium sp.]|nr:NAD(P)-dependent oxidoreductase [Bradyrhizobium sp.]